MVMKAVVLAACWSRTAGLFEGVFLTRKLESNTVIVQ